MNRLTDKRLALPSGVWQEVTREQRMELQEIPVPSMRELYYRLSQIEDILGDEYDLGRLRELARADREGRCVVLPCKLGDTVYFITGTYNSLVKPAKVEEIYIGDGSIALGVSTDFTTFTLQESEWHLTRAEAEAALAKLNSET